jgi:poly(A) polymerase
MHKKATQIVETLKEKGFIAYFAGGWVRDFLLGIDSDDIDIATNAPPETIEKLFPHTIPIGKAFGIILVIMNEHKYEVATFRKDIEYKDGRRPSAIEYTTAFEDAKRRDFTINGMFFDPLSEKVMDYVGGEEDLKKKIIRAIGNPHERIKEDRLRMLRAIRLSSKFDFEIEEKTKKAILAHSNELTPFVAIERFYQ